jgi:hypothetical protein
MDQRFSLQPQSDKENERERDPLDALRKWYRSTGEELRRLEYEYYKYFRTKKFLSQHKKKHKQEYGKFSVIPEYTQELEDSDWQAFRESFLLAPDKKERLLQIINACKNDLPKIKQRVEEELKNLCTIKSIREPQAFLIGGSVAIGPRNNLQDPATDIDIFVVLKDAIYKNGFPADFQIVDMLQDGTELRYQIIFVGESSEHVPSFMPIHILSQPYIVLESVYDDSALNVLQNKSIKHTIDSIPFLRSELLELKKKLEDAKNISVLE